MTRRLTISDPDLHVPPTYVHVPTQWELTILLAMSTAASGGSTYIEAAPVPVSKVYTEGYAAPKLCRSHGRVLAHLRSTHFHPLLRRNWIEPYYFATFVVRFQLSMTGRNLITLLRDKE